MRFTRRCSFAVLVACLTSSGCATLGNRRLTLPADHSLVRQQLVVHSDFPLPAHHRLLEELVARRDDIVEKLGLPLSDEPIHVYLFENADQFGAFMRMHHPAFPLRRAFFLETDTRLQVYAHWGDRVAEDLRHEVTHGYLHSVVPSLPLWLDEGLAEYFEVPRGHHGLNRSQWENLQMRIEEGRWRPDLPRLESLSPSDDMSRDDYAESWAWVHFFLESPLAPTELIRGFLRDVRLRGSAEPLSVRVGRVLPHPERLLVAHIQGLTAAP